ncbi:thymic stromal cotransporter homolog [Rhinatrema bivittatum]|uniref:thymic stromal cotransporter homolog n=1 Tax=Rhinatrema bivittatum TaxID=194408 RepID=UPI0011279905|nr:thymic stromal cotransporter homolog [Rhinatrema bivittatum]
MARVMLVRTWIHPVVAGAQIGCSFYDTGLLMVVKNYYSQSNSSVSTREEEQQKAISNFYIIYNLVLCLSPLPTAYILARLGDEKNRKITICMPLCGSLLSRIMLLLVILQDWPIEVIYGSAVFSGLTGGFTAYWAEIMALAALSSSENGRSLKLTIIELTYGMAGFIGSLASGHIFIKYKNSYRQGTILISSSIGLYAFCLFYSLLVLKIPMVEETSHKTEEPNTNEGEAIEDGGYKALETERLEEQMESNATCNSAENHSSMTPSMEIIALLFISAVLYNLAVVSALDVLPLFLLKNPLNWGPVDIGYGNAAGYFIYITSFMGVYIFSKYVRDTTMVMIGIISFSVGMFILAFVRWSFLYYVARAVMLFSYIPLPTIRSMLSKEPHGSSCGKVFVVLQLTLEITGVILSTICNKIYQVTMDWFSGFCFILACIISCLSLIPISIVHHKESVRQGYNTICPR